MPAARWQPVAAMLDIVPKLRPASLIKVSPTYRFRSITADPEDDKFADCAIAAEADYIITSDRHFDALAGSGYRPPPITPGEFIQRHLGVP